MRVPIRKPGKYTHLKPDYKITKKKFDELNDKLEKLINVSRPRAAEEVARMAHMGDFSENTGYQYAKGRLRGINQRILEIEDMLKRAEIIEPNGSSDTIQLGHLATVESAGKTKTYHILGSSETKPERGVISHNSPLGAALIGKHIGEVVKVQLASKAVEYKIIKIE